MEEKKDDLGLIVLDNIIEIGKKVNGEICGIRKVDKNYMVPVKIERFTNGEAKAQILSSVRDKDIYILTDVGNYMITYKMHGYINHYSPDDHFTDLKRVILAMMGHAKKITVIMPLLYESRQHRRKGRESLDCSQAMQELEHLGVKDIITFDVHDPNICNAVPLLAFDNIYPTNIILEKFARDNISLLNNLLIISPDFGAMERARYFAEMLKCDMGVFYKRRDLSKVINGKNPVVEHTYIGRDVENKNVIIVDDMIATGTSIIDVAEDMKRRGAKKIFLASTFSLFTEGVQVFDDAFEKGLFDALYTTNLTYVKEEIKEKPRFKQVDCSYTIAKVIDKLNRGESISNIINVKEEFFKKLEKIQNGE